MKLRTHFIFSALLATGLAACSNPSAIPNPTIAEAVSRHSGNNDENQAKEKRKAEADEANDSGETDDSVTVRKESQSSDRPQERTESRPETEPETEVVEQESTESDTEDNAPAGELWRWDLEVGETYSLQYDATTDMEMNIGGEMAGMMGGMQGMGDMSDEITVYTEMNLEVEERLSDGRYDLRIPIQRLEIRSSAGQRFTVDDVPENVRVLRAYMTPRGTLEFYERVVVEVKEQGAYAIVKFTEDGSTTRGEATVGAGGMEVTSRAEVDPETGRITASHEVRKREQPTREVEEEQPAQHLDVLPVDVLSLLELPEGRVREGDRLEFETPLGVANIDVLEPEQCGARTTCGQLRSRFDMDNEQANQMMKDAAGPDAESQAAMAMNPSVTGAFDATMLFNIEAGKLFNIEGTSESNTDAHGSLP